MPLRRTPPSAHTPNMFCSDPNLSASSEADAHSPAFISHRSKRRREDEGNSDYDNFKSEIFKMFQDLKAGQKLHSASLQSVKDELLAQNNKLQETVEFLAVKYDEILGKLKNVEDARSNDRKCILKLEGKIEQLERKLRCSSVEIRNVPATGKESKENLMDMVMKVGNSVNIQIQQHDFKDVFRSNHISGKTAVIVELNSTILKEKLIKSVNLFNRNKPIQEKLNTSHLGMKGPKTPIFVSENLPSKTRKLFNLTKEFASKNKYKYCWTSYGQVYLRKNDGDIRTIIESETDLTKLHMEK